MILQDYFDTVYNRLTSAVKGVCQNAGKETIGLPAAFPYMDVSLEECPASLKAADLEDMNNAVEPVIKITVYTEGQEQADLARKILSLAGAEMQQMLFRRSLGPQRVAVPDTGNIFCLSARYTRVICDGDLS